MSTVLSPSTVLSSLPSRDEARARLAECESGITANYKAIDELKKQRAFWTRLLKFVQATGGGGGAAGGKKRGRKPKKPPYPEAEFCAECERATTVMLISAQKKLVERHTEGPFNWTEDDNTELRILDEVLAERHAAQTAEHQAATV